MKRLFAAAVAALTLAACDEAKPAPSSTPKPLALRPRVAPPRPLVTPTPKPPPVVEVPTDALVLAHDTPDVNHLARARRLSEEGDVKGALTESRRALYSAPQDVETLRAVATLAKGAGQLSMAAEAWGRLAVVQPDDATPLVQQARVLLMQKDAAGAIMASREATTRDDGNPEAWQALGRALLSAEDIAGAITSFSKAVDLSPNHGWALNNLGFACLRANENARAVEVLQRAAEALPNVALVHNNLGIALEREGYDDEAKVAYQRAMDLSPKYVKARLNADRVARADVARALEGEPDSLSDVHPLP